LCIAAGAALPVAHGKVTIEAMKHDIQQITPQNFDGVISKFRDSAVGALWFFDEDNKADAAFFDEYNKLAGDMKGMMKITALNCAEFRPYCTKQGVKETPHVQIYPLNPMPTFKYEGKLEAKALSGKMSKFLLDQSVKITKENVDAFATGDATKPKVFLFSNKKAPPSIWKALSSETVFRRSVKFGFVHEDEKDVVAKYKVTKFPTVIMQRGSKAEIKEPYKGDMNFEGLKTWVNLFSESGMGDKVQGAGGKEEVSIEESKPWLVQEVPELTGKSQQDICFKGEGLCVIYLKEGALSQDETDMLTGLSKKFTSQLSDRGAKMKWMWLDLAAEAEYKKLFAPTQLPSATVFNPHKRLRFANMDHGEEGEVKGDTDGLTKLMDKVLGGDARFKMVPGQKLPAWAVRDDKGKKEL
jgi:hypothetical protein